VIITARRLGRQPCWSETWTRFSAPVNVALAAEYRTCCALTLDCRDFRAIRPLTPHPAFQLLPDDM
jgi:hypothetical protein